MKKVLFFCLFLAACGPQPHPQTLQLNREGSTLLKNQSFSAALDKFISGLQFNPYQAELHLNMGLAFEGLQQNEKAQQSYHQAGELARTGEAKFMALFNEAQLLGKAKKVDEAIALYQQALDLLPTSKEAKTNIELLTQDQQGQGGGDGENKDQKNQDQKDQKDKKDQDKKDDKDKKDPKDDKDDKKDEKDKEGKQDQKKQYQNSPKYQPKKFDSKDLSESDVKKILGELRQQEQKIRAEFNRKEVKEQPRAKDW